MNTDTKKVLIIEDELPIRRALVDAFSQRSLACLEADNGETGLHACLEHKPDYIVLDILMPKMDGMTMLKELRKDAWGAHARVLILTNYSVDDPERVRAVVAAAPEQYLIKSDWSIDDIAGRVEAALR